MMAVARQNELQQRFVRLEKEVEALRKNRFTASTASEFMAATVGILPLILTIIAVVAGSNYLLSERMTEMSVQFNNRIDDVNKRIDDTNDLIRTVKSDLEKDISNLEKDIADIDAKLDRLLLK